MNHDAKLQKVILGPDWIDLSFGEPKIVMDNLFRQINRFGDPFQMPKITDILNWSYQPAAGKPDLVKLLEDKHGSPAIVCNGAKQALAAAGYAFRRRGIGSIWYDIPYYPANPSIFDAAGLPWAEYSESNSYLITSPNNPDGKITSNTAIKACKYDRPTIHDAAYYTHIYLPPEHELLPLGDIQIYSMSKMYGISGLRIGYAICHSQQYYQDMVDYMELTTAGVSTASQDIARNIELFFKENPKYYNAFVVSSREAIIEARKELVNLDPEVLIPEEPEANSMFAWCKVGPKLDHKAAKVHILPGEIFGKPGYMRLNIAHPPNIIREAISRLNEHKIRS